MQHEDRILRSIDLLTSNARETLNKYVEWAKTSKSNVTFNLFDALPSYDSNGSTGSGIYTKPITIPSFSSISSGIFGEIATDNERDINWNFNFIANGKGWSFDEYVQANGSSPKSQITPKLSINVDTVFGKTKTGKKTNIKFVDNTITYDSSNSSLTIDDSGLSYLSNIFDIYSNKTIINGEDIQIGSNSLLVDGIKNPVGFIEKGSKSVTISSKKIKLSSNALDILDFDGSDIFLGNKLTNSFRYSKNVEDYFTGNYSTSTHDITGRQFINLLKYDIASSKITIAEGSVSNVTLGDKSNRLTSNTNEALQLFVSNSGTPKVWIEGGLDAYYGNRKTATYSDIFSGKIDSEIKAISSSSPYYLKVGSVGTTHIEGQDSLSLTSNEVIGIGIGNTKEITITKGQVSIPNLALPQMARIALSTLSKRSQVDNYGPTIVFPTNSSNFNNGVEVSTLTSFSSYQSLEKNTFVWSSFNSDGSYIYNYVYSLINNGNSYDLICKTYRVIGENSSINLNTPLYTTTIVENLPLSIKKDDIFAVSGLNDTYVLVKSDEMAGSISGQFWNTNLITPYVGVGLTVYKSKNRGSSYYVASKIPLGYSDFSNTSKISASTSSADVINCGIQDRLAILIQDGGVGYSTTTGNATSVSNKYVVFVFDSNTETMYDKCNGKLLSFNNEWNISNEAYNSMYSRLASISILGDSVYVISSKIINSEYEGSITKIDYLNGSENKTLTLPKAIFGLGQGRLTDIRNMFLVNTLTMSNVSHLGNPEIIASTIFSQYNSNGTIDETSTRINVGFNFKISSDFTAIAVEYTTIPSGNMYSTYITTESSYYLTENCGYVSSDIDKKTLNVVLFKKSNTESTLKYLQLITNNYYEVGGANTVTLITQSTIKNNTGYVLPINKSNFAVYSNSSVMFAHLPLTNATIDYSQLTTNTISVTKDIVYVNPYAKMFKGNYVDNLGAVLSNGSCINYVISNNKSKEISYTINSYALDDNNLNESIIENTVAGKIANVVSVANDVGSVYQLFNSFVYKDYTKSPLVNYVSFSAMIDGLEVPHRSLKSLSTPISITSCGNNSLTFDRYSGIILSNNANINIGTSGADSKIAIPVEALSIFAKRSYSNITTPIVRDDFTITFNTNISNNISATLEYVTLVSNNGHREQILEDASINKYAVKTMTSRSFVINKVTLIFDLNHNRVLAWAQQDTSSIGLVFDEHSIKTTKRGILYSIDASLLNTYDDNFNNYLSIVNEKGNVVSIRTDYINTLSIQTTNTTLSGVICGFSEINNQEEGC